MAIVVQTGNSNISNSGPLLLDDEFLPIIKLNYSINPDSDNKNEFIARGDKVLKDKTKITTLSEYVDEDKRNIEEITLFTSKKELIIPFSVKKGSVKSEDDDGVIRIETSLNKEKIAIKKVESYDIKDKNILEGDGFKASYDTFYEISFSINLKKETSFIIDFYARDDEDDEGMFEHGELVNVHCGRLKIEFLIPGPEVFSKSEYDTYKSYIIRNANQSYDPNTEKGYGYGESDKHDCVTTVTWSMRKLLIDNSIPAKANMDGQMLKLVNIDYAIEQTEIEYKDEKGRKTSGITDPKDFLNKSLTDILKEKIGKHEGYYFFGMSIMTGYHSVMIVVKKTDKLKFQIFDQLGSAIGNDLEYEKTIGINSWFSSSQTNEWLLDYVEYGYVTDSQEKGKTTTNIYQIKHKNEG